MYTMLIFQRHHKNSIDIYLLPCLNTVIQDWYIYTLEYKQIVFSYTEIIDIRYIQK